MIIAIRRSSLLVRSSPFPLYIANAHAIMKNSDVPRDR